MSATTVLFVASHLSAVSLVAGTGLTPVQSSGSCLETNLSFICNTTGEGGTQISLDSCSEQTGLPVQRHSIFQDGLQQEVTCSTDSGRITISNITRSPTKQCFDHLRNETDYCYITFIDVTLNESNSCRMLRCDTVDGSGTTKTFGNTSIANEPPAPSQLNATRMLQGQTTIANFTWTGETNNCTADKTLKYRVGTNNCGSCPTSVDIDDDFIVCEGIAAGDQCNVSVQTIAPCNAVSIPEMLLIIGLEPDTAETMTQPLNVRAIIGGAVGGGGFVLLLLIVVLVVVVVCLVRKPSCKSKSDSNGTEIRLEEMNGSGREGNKSTEAAESSFQDGDSYDHATHGVLNPMFRSGEDSEAADNLDTDIPNACSTPCREDSSNSVATSGADDTSHPQNTATSYSLVPTLKTGNPALDQMLAGLEIKSREHDAKFVEQDVKFSEQRKKIGSLKNKVGHLQEALQTLRYKCEDLQQKLDKERSMRDEDRQKSDEEIKRLKNQMAQKEKQLSETTQELEKAQKELRIMREQRVASKRESTSSQFSTL